MSKPPSLLPGPLASSGLDVLYDVAGVRAVVLQLLGAADRLEPVNKRRSVMVGQPLGLWIVEVVHGQFGAACELNEQD